MSQTLGERIFGANGSPKLYGLLFKEDITVEEAKEVLDAVQNPGIRGLLDDLEARIQSGSPRPPAYALLGDMQNTVACLFGAGSPQEASLLADTYNVRNFLSAFYRLIEKAHPEYQLPKHQQLKSWLERSLSGSYIK